VQHALVVRIRHRVADLQDHFECARDRPVVAVGVWLFLSAPRRAKS
jgi:hypothetical protein